MSKYIEASDVRSMELKRLATGQSYSVKDSNIFDAVDNQVENITSAQRKRKRKTGKSTIFNEDIEAEAHKAESVEYTEREAESVENIEKDNHSKEVAQVIGSPNKRIDSLERNGFKISRIATRYFISAVDVNTLERKFADSSIQVGDEVIT